MKRCKNCRKDHALHLTTRAKRGTCLAYEVTVVRGAIPYLRLEGFPVPMGRAGAVVLCLDGGTVLRRTAEAILRCLPAERKAMGRGK